jgi:replicative DNA helicase
MALADLDAERALVSACVVHPDALARVSFLDADDLADSSLCAVLKAVRAAALRGDVNAATITIELRRAKAFNAIGGERYLLSLLDGECASAYVETWARRIADLARLRRTETTLRRALARVHDGFDVPAEAQADASSLVATIAEDRPAHAYDLTSHASAAFEELQRRNEERMRGLHLSASWGVAALDAPEALGGLTGGALYVLAADTGSGKTTLAWQAAEATATVGLRVLVYSQEMPGPELMLRVAGAMVGLSTAQLRAATLTEQQLADLAAAMGRLAQMPIEIRDSGDATPDKIRAEVLAERARGGLGLVVVDYLQILEVGPEQRKAPTVEALSYATKTLKRTAVRARVPILLLSQFNRGRDTASKPLLKDLKGSGSIEQDADAVVFLHHDGDTTIAVVAKHRHGPPGEYTLRWDRARGRFEDRGYDRPRATFQREVAPSWDDPDEPEVPFTSAGGDAE